MTALPRPWRVAAAAFTIAALTAVAVAAIAGITHIITERWSPLPARPPWDWSIGDIADWFASDATGTDATTVATQLLAAVAYVMVAVIAVNLFAELVDQARHGIVTQPARRTRRHRAWRPAFTASLVALLLGASTLTTTATAIGLPERAPISAVIDDHAPTAPGGPALHQAVSAEATPLPAGMRWGTYTVQRADESLKSIAATISGDPALTRTIWDANQHHHVTPTDTLTDPTIVRVGWTLTVPVPATTDPTQQTTPPDTTVAATHLVVVEPGDNLYRLIDDVVDEPQPEDVDAVARANDGTATSDGTFVFHASNPNLIHPSQTFDLQPAIDLDVAQATAPNPAEILDAAPSSAGPPAPVPEAPAEQPGPGHEPPVEDPAQATPAPLPTADPEGPVASIPMIDRPSTETELPPAATPPVVTMPLPPIPIPATAIPPSPAQPGDIAPAPAPEPAHGAETSDQSAPVPALGAGGLALAGLLFALDRRRRRNRTYRPVGHTINPPDEELGTSERILRGAAHLDRALRTNLALRQLAPALANRATPLRARHLSVNDKITIVFDRPALPPPGWVTGTNDTSWVCTVGDDDLTLTEHEPNPWPAVLPIGTLDDGTDVLIDLEAHGILAITGPGAQPVISALVTAIASSPYTELLTLLDPDTVQLHGLAPLLEHRLAVRDTNDIIERLTTWISPFQHHETHLLAARRQWGTELEPCIAAITAPLDDEQRQQLAVLPLDGTQPIAIITTDSQLATTTLTVHADGTSQIDGLHVHCHRLEPASATATAALHHQADHLTTTNTSALQQYRSDTDTDFEPAVLNVHLTISSDSEPADSLAEPVDHDEVHVTEPAPAELLQPDELQLFDTDPDVDWTIKLLGPLEITHTDGYTLTTPRARELLTLLALHPHGLTKQQLEHRLWPLGDSNQTTAGGAGLTPRLSELRKALGNGDTARGRTYLPVHTTTRGYHVTGVEADSHRFFALVDAANRTTGQDKINALAGALHLVRGQIGSGEITAYSWINHHLDTIEAGVVDAGLELGHLALAQHNYKLADWAATQIRLASPYEQRAIPIAIAARQALGDTVGIRRLHDDTTDTVDQLEPDVQHAFQQALAT